jgi:hypothetical protein
VSLGSSLSVDILAGKFQPRFVTEACPCLVEEGARSHGRAFALYLDSHIADRRTPQALIYRVRESASTRGRVFKPLTTFVIVQLSQHSWDEGPAAVVMRVGRACVVLSWDEHPVRKSPQSRATCGGLPREAPLARQCDAAAGDH